MHERLEHFPFPQEEDGDDIILKACGPGQGVSRSIPEKMNPTTELVELFANTTIEHERGSKYVEWENMDTGCVSHKYISHVTIGDAKIVVDGDLSVGTEVDVNSMEAFMQTAPGTVPVSLVLFAWSNEEYEPFNECNQFRFDMGLKETGTSHFLAALFSCTVGVESFLDLYCKDDPNEDKFPIIRGNWTLLNVLVDSDHSIRIDWLGHGRRFIYFECSSKLRCCFCDRDCCPNCSHEPFYSCCGQEILCGNSLEEGDDTKSFCASEHTTRSLACGHTTCNFYQSEIEDGLCRACKSIGTNEDEHLASSSENGTRTRNEGTKLDDCSNQSGKGTIGISCTESFSVKPKKKQKRSFAN
jgi:hypothetical protein